MNAAEKIYIRPEVPADYRKVERLVEKAFRHEEYSDHREQLLVARLRQSQAFIPELSLVAEAGGELAGYILLTGLRIVAANESFEALALAPVAVLPALQGQGIGGKLIEAAHKRARALGHQRIVLVGHANYYPRFGYQPCEQYGIDLPFAVPPENAMVKELQAGALKGVRGEVLYPAEFFEHEK